MPKAKEKAPPERQELKLKFSHDYRKLPLDWENKKAYLVGLYAAKIGTLREKLGPFLDYDTKFGFGEGAYELPKTGRFLVLFFLMVRESKRSPVLFSTIRRYTEEKKKYYLDNLGNLFTLVKTGNGGG